VVDVVSLDVKYKLTDIDMIQCENFLPADLKQSEFSDIVKLMSLHQLTSIDLKQVCPPLV